MGSKNCPETPRQKMINMMYLVLTAMLALNVAAETLYAFKIVDTSLMKTLESFTTKNNAVYTDFEAAYTLNASKVEQWMQKANEVRASSDSLINYITDTKELLVNTSGAIPHEVGTPIDPERAFMISSKGDTIIIKQQDDLNVSPEVMINKGKGEELCAEISKYRKFLLSMVDSSNTKLISNISSALDVSDSESDNKSWIINNFESSPLIASITLLSKMQIDVRNAESGLITYLYNQIDASSFKFNKLEAQVVPKSKYIISGDPYEAKIFLSAVDTTRISPVFVGGKQLDIENHKAIYKVTTSTPGVYSYKGYINFEMSDGSVIPYPFEDEYQVAEPTGAISLTKMNLLYIGLENPINISVSGVPAESLEPSINNGTIKKSSDGCWVVAPSDLDEKGQKTKITVYANIDGQKRQMAELRCKVKMTPRPEPLTKSGTVSRSELKNMSGLFYVMPEDFEFEGVKYEVVSFRMAYQKSSYTNYLPSTLASGLFDDKQKKALESLNAGDVVRFEEIKVRMKGVSNVAERSLSPVIYVVKN